MTRKITAANADRRSFLKAAGAGGALVLAGCVGADGDEEDPNEQQPQTQEEDGLDPAEATDVDTIARDPTDVPDPIDRDEPVHHEWELHTEELVAEIEPGVTHRFMTFDGTVPGPLLRARVGDT